MKVLFKSLGYVVILILIFTVEATATQVDYTGYDEIMGQEWILEFTISEYNDYCVRFPYPDYTMMGRWADYATSKVEIILDCDVIGPWYYEETHYNEGYSNQGVWIKVFYPVGPITFTYKVNQSGQLGLPGYEYGMAHHTNNSWMCGTDIVDVDAQIVEDVLWEAQAMAGDWHQSGYWSEPEKIVNWLNQNMEWVDDDRYEPWSASYILDPAVRCGNCDEWAHAACALLLKAGIPAKVVMVGTTTGYNATNYFFPEVELHLCAAYWDGFGWIMIDPQVSSGFTFVSRVVLGADRDSRSIMISTFPEDLIYDIDDSSVSCSDGYQSGFLQEENARCSLYPWEILEHYSYDDVGILEGTEPLNCILSGVSSVENNPVAKGEMFFVNYPNPFNPVTTFRFNVRKEGRVRIDIFSVDGRRLCTVLDSRMSPGEKEISWFSDGLSSGIYFARFECPSGSSARKVIVLK